MGSGYIVMRDPVLYRIQRSHHHRTGDAWCIYPMYDFAHPLSDSIENITHSICTLEFENNRPLYDWVVNETDTPHKPRQIEFARLNLTYTVMSKRKLLELVTKKYVNGWDDPRMPTIAGLRRRVTHLNLSVILRTVSVLPKRITWLTLRCLNTAFVKT
jgi:glutaminyl-tRNA synthetase